MLHYPELDYTRQFGYSDDYNHRAYRSAGTILRWCESIVQCTVAPDCRTDICRNPFPFAIGEERAVECAVWLCACRRRDLPICVRRRRGRGRRRNATWRVHDDSHRNVGIAESLRDGNAQGAMSVVS